MQPVMLFSVAQHSSAAFLRVF